jgi:hypothetical protein
MAYEEKLLRCVCVLIVDVYSVHLFGPARCVLQSALHGRSIEGYLLVCCSELSIDRSLDLMHACL